MSTIECKILQRWKSAGAIRWADSGDPACVFQVVGAGEFKVHGRVDENANNILRVVTFIFVGDWILNCSPSRHAMITSETGVLLYEVQILNVINDAQESGSDDHAHVESENYGDFCEDMVLGVEEGERVADEQRHCSENRRARAEAFLKTPQFHADEVEVSDMTESEPTNSKFAVRKSYDGGVCFGDSSCHVEKVFVRLRQEEDDEFWDGIAAVRFSGINEIVRDLAGKYGQKHPELQHILDHAILEDKDLEFVQNNMSKWLNECWRSHPKYRAGVVFECVVCKVKPVLYSIDEHKVKVLSQEVPTEAEEILNKVNRELAGRKDVMPDLSPLWQLAQTSKNDDCFVFEWTGVKHTRGDNWLSFLKINVCPGEKSSVEFKLKKEECKIVEVVLEVGKEEFVWIPGGVNRLKPKDIISLGKYQKLKMFSLGREPAKVRIKNSSGGTVISRLYDCKTPKDNKVVQVDFDRSWFEDGNEYVLFMDMGSTRTKYITMPICDDRFDVAAFSKTDKHLKKTVDFFREKCNEVSLTDLLPEDFPAKATKEVDLGQFKPWMRKHEDEYARFLIKAIHWLAEREDGRRIFSKVYWSFPMVGTADGDRERFFNTVQENVNQEVRDCILDDNAFELVAEHEALRNMYEGFTQAVAMLVKEKQDKIDETIKARPNLLKSWWDGFLMNPRTRIMREAYNLQRIKLENERDREFTKDAKKIYNLFKEKGKNATADWLLMDAGGFSMDMYCTKNGNPEPDLCGSFVAGGIALRNKFHECYARIVEGRDSDWDQDFERKYDMWCVDGFNGRKKEAMHTALETVYGSIKNMLDWRNVSLVVLSGGVTANKQFYEIVLTRGVVVSAYTLSVIVSTYQDACQDKKPWMAFFEKLVSTDNGVGSEYDIVGGMIQKACPNLFEVR